MGDDEKHVVVIGVQQAFALRRSCAGLSEALPFRLHLDIPSSLTTQRLTLDVKILARFFGFVRPSYFLGIDPILGFQPCNREFA